MTGSAPGLVSVDEDLMSTYRHLHRHPELSMAEFETSRYLQSVMTDLGIETVAVGSTGFVAVVRNGDGPVVAFRADMDGLPVREETGLHYASTVLVKAADGSDVPVMHACGHDIHMTVAVGLARQLRNDRTGWSGTVLIIFQPGEESAQGAQDIVEAGLWDQLPTPTCIFGLHVWPIRAGTVELISGDTMAMADSFEVTITGKGGHGSQPHNTVDPIVIAAHAIVALQSIVSRTIDPQTSAVVTVGTIHAGSKENIIPSQATFTLNVRSTEPTQRAAMLSSIRTLLGGIAAAHGAPNPVVRDINSFPRLYSDPTLVNRLHRTLTAALGEDRVSLGRTKMASEDFGRLADAAGIPGAYWFIGGNNSSPEGGPVPQNHSPHFAPDPSATLDVGVRTAVLACYSVVGTADVDHINAPL